MSYTALYRKLRPKIFKDVVGQDAIVRTLKNQICTKRVSHAYLFCGTRGTGKTSTAKIFAKAINCLDPAEGEPCNQCSICKDIDLNKSMNVIEIDAASNNGVDSIRELRDEVRYTPATGKYKVYIIDEVHMLSTGAFNALLKTLEEPPNYVIFILATTDPQKVLATILSRCQRFDFKRITEGDMVFKIKEYLVSDNIEIEDSALKYIASLSDGAMRDALSILDQCIAFYFDEKIKLEHVLEVVGAVDNTIIFEITEALSNYDVNKCLKIVDEVILRGRDISQFVTEWITHIRNILVSKSDVSSLNMSNEYKERSLKQAEKISHEMLIHYINELSELKNQLKVSFSDRIMIEVCIIKLCSLPAKEDENLYIRIKKLEEMLEKGEIKKSVKVNIEDTKKEEKKEIKKEKAILKDMEKICGEWKSISSEFEAVTKALIGKTTAEYIDNNILCIISKDNSTKETLNTRKEKIKEVLSSKYEKELDIKIMTKEEFDAGHKDIYKSEDGGEIVSDNVFTDKINMDIIFEN